MPFRLYRNILWRLPNPQQRCDHVYGVYGCWVSTTRGVTIDMVANPDC